MARGRVSIDLPRLWPGIGAIAAAVTLVACSAGHPSALPPDGPPGGAVRSGAPASTTSTAGSPGSTAGTSTSTSTTRPGSTTTDAPGTTSGVLVSTGPGTTATTVPRPPSTGTTNPPTTRTTRPAPPPTGPPGTEAPWPPTGGSIPTGPPPSNYGPDGGYGLFHGTCDTTGGEYGYGQITTHWDQYRGTAAVQYIEMVAAFSSSATPKTPIPGVTYTNIQNVSNPSWGQPIPVGGRHQDGPLYLEFRSPTPNSVISVSFYWLDANHNVLWQSPTPLTWSC